MERKTKKQEHPNTPRRRCPGRDPSHLQIQAAVSILLNQVGANEPMRPQSNCNAVYSGIFTPPKTQSSWPQGYDPLALAGTTASLLGQCKRLVSTHIGCGSGIGLGLTRGKARDLNYILFEKENADYNYQQQRTIFRVAKSNRPLKNTNFYEHRGRIDILSVTCILNIFSFIAVVVLLPDLESRPTKGVGG